MTGSRFAGRVVLVTGAGSGIGRATAVRFAAEGAVVVALDIDERAARDTVASLAAAEHGAQAIAADVTDRNSVAEAVGEVLARHERIDVLVNNVGVAGTDGLLETSDEAWLRVLDLTLGGTFRMTRAVLPAMLAQGRGAIVNLSSVNGHAMFGDEGYSAAKAGVESLTRSTAVRYAPVRVNAVVPGTVRTEAWNQRLAVEPGALDALDALYPLGRIGEPEDIAAAVAFLASDDAAWISGTTLLVDGGLMAARPSREPALEYHPPTP